MIKVKVEGPGARLVGGIITQALKDAGLKANYWRDVTPGGVANCRRDASREDSQVSVVAMTR